MCVNSAHNFHIINYIMMSQRLIAMLLITGELIMSRYVAESITTDAGRFSHVGLCHLHTKLKIQQCETNYIESTDQFCYIIVRRFVIG